MTGGTGETDYSSRSEVRGFGTANPELQTSSRAFLAFLALHEPQPLAACFSILLAVEGFASIAEQIVVRREGFVPRVGRIDLDDTEFFLVPRRAMQNRPAWSDDFAVPDKRQLIFAAS